MIVKKAFFKKVLIFYVIYIIFSMAGQPAISALDPKVLASVYVQEDIKSLCANPTVFKTRSGLSVTGFSSDAANPYISDMITRVTEHNVLSWEKKLTGELPVTVDGKDYIVTTRNTFSGIPIQNALQYVYEHFKSLGLTTQYHDWSYTDSGSSAITGKNIIAEITGTRYPDESIIICAHLDNMPSSGKAPGADDNASGSTGVITAAEIMSNYSFERTVRFILFTGEEQGLLGSDAYTKTLEGTGKKVVGVLNLDMIGNDTGAHTVNLIVSEYKNETFITDTFSDIVENYGLSSSLNLNITASIPAYSDHIRFRGHNIPAVLCTEGDISPFYHKENDTVENIDISFISNITKASVGTIAALAVPVDGQLSTPVKYTLSGYVKPDITSADSSVNAGIKVEVIEAGLSSTTNTDGYFSITNLPANYDGYTIKISKLSLLERTVNNFAVTEDTQLGSRNYPVEIWCGDIAVDNAINIRDVINVASCFNTAVGSSRYNPQFDFNCDSSVNMTDIMTLVMHFNKTSAHYPKLN